jgi:hypothetical protein
MQSDDRYIERTPDQVAKVRALREAAMKEMNRFTCAADYDVRRVVGHGPKPAPVSAETVAPSPTTERPKKSAGRSASAQPTLEFPPAPAERGDDGDGV